MRTSVLLWKMLVADCSSHLLCLALDYDESNPLHRASIGESTQHILDIRTCQGTPKAWTREEVQVYVAQVREEIKNPQTDSYGLGVSDSLDFPYECVINGCVVDECGRGIPQKLKANHQHHHHCEGMRPDMVHPWRRSILKLIFIGFGCIRRICQTTRCDWSIVKGVGD